jgi:hypothetical protein
MTSSVESPKNPVLKDSENGIQNINLKRSEETFFPLAIWAFTSLPSIFKAHIRSGSRGKVTLQQYANHTLAGGSVSTVTLKKLYGYFTKENNLSKRECDLTRVVTLLKTMFVITVTQKRRMMNGKKRTVRGGMKELSNSPNAEEVPLQTRIEPWERMEEQAVVLFKPSPFASLSAL